MSAAGFPIALTIAVATLLVLRHCFGREQGDANALVARRRLAALALTVAGAAMIAAPQAFSDGDPASDYLVGTNVFFPLQPPPPAAAAALDRQVRAVYGRRFRIKVAVIGTKVDLGAVPSLFNRPSEYAKFLGFELRLYYIGPLLIVMPAGFGIYDGGRPTAAEERVLAGMRVKGSSSEDLVVSARDATGALLVAGALRSKDILAPAAAPMTVTGRRGRPMRLTYTVFDDSGRSSVLLEVLAGSSTVATLPVAMRPVRLGATYWEEWTVPVDFPTGSGRICASARDEAGNASKRFCAPLVISE